MILCCCCCVWEGVECGHRAGEWGGGGSLEREGRKDRLRFSLRVFPPSKKKNYLYHPRALFTLLRLHDSLLEAAFGRGRRGPGARRAGPGGARGRRERGRDEHRRFRNGIQRTTTTISIVVLSDSPGRRVGRLASSSSASAADQGRARRRSSQAAKGAQAGGDEGHLFPSLEREEGGRRLAGREEREEVEPETEQMKNNEKKTFLTSLQPRAR